MKDSLTNRAAASIKAENGLPLVCKVGLPRSTTHINQITDHSI